MKNTIIYIFIAGIFMMFYSCDKTEKDYSDADAVFEKIVKTYTLQENDSIDYRYQHKLKLNSYYAFNRLYGETFVVYNPNHQDLKINESVTTMADGKKVPSPDNAFNEVLPRFAEGAPPYSHLREMVITHTGLERNSTINLDYEIKSDKEIRPFLMGNEVLAESSPVKELVIRIKVPEDKNLNYQLLNVEEDLNIAKKGNYTEYEWVFKNISPFSQESNQPQYGTNLPRLIFSTENLNSTYTYLSDEIDYSLPEGIVKSIDEALLNAKTKFDSIRSIQNMVVNHMNHFDVPIKYSGYKLKSNETVLEDNGGTTEEKTVLLASLLRKIGINAEPVSIIPSEYFNEEMGILEVFEEYYVKLNYKDHLLYLSAIENNQINSKFKYSNEKNLVIGNQAPEEIDFQENKSSVEINGNIALSKNFKLEGQLSTYFSYCENPYFQIKNNEEAVKSLISGVISPSAVTDYKIDTILPEESKINYGFKINITPKQQGNYYFIEIPTVNTGLDKWDLKGINTERKTPMQLDYPLEIKYHYILKKPEEFKLIAGDINVQNKNQAGNLLINIKDSGENIEIKKELSLNENIPEEHYEAFYKLMSNWYKDKYSHLVLKKPA